MKQLSQKGFSAIIALVVVLVIAGVGAGGWYVWKKNQKKDETSKPSGQTGQKQEATKKEEKPLQDEIANWTSVTTQGGKFSMKIPDGWRLTSYPGDYLGAVDIIHKPGIAATTDTTVNEYAGHSLRFRASVLPLDDAGIGPQWSSPQPGLEESNQAFSIDSLQGKRFKAVFSGDLNQTLYEYVFDLGNNKKLDIVYTIYTSENEADDVTTVEKAIKSININ